MGDSHDEFGKVGSEYFLILLHKFKAAEWHWVRF